MGFRLKKFANSYGESALTREFKYDFNLHLNYSKFSNKEDLQHHYHFLASLT